MNTHTVSHWRVFDEAGGRGHPLMGLGEEMVAKFPRTSCFFCVYVGVSKNRGTPKWMVYNGKPY